MAKLDSLFKNSDVKRTEEHPKRVTKWIHYTKLRDNDKQYCNEKDTGEIEMLADLIDASEGVLQNLLVKKVDNDEYTIIAGHKRRRACALLVEQRGKKQYEFIPCYVEDINEVQAEFQLYSSNSHHEKTDYERMVELERMKYLLENYPEEFPNLQTGRMVERLAAQMNMSRTTVGEYLNISKNLGETARTAFENGSLKKSAAMEMAALPEETQEQLIDQGITAQKDIKAYKEAALEPSEKEIRLFYNNYVKEYDQKRGELKEWLVDFLGKGHTCGAGGAISYQCSPRGIRLNNSGEITWAKFVNKINEFFPVINVKAAEPVPESGTETDAEECNDCYLNHDPSYGDLECHPEEGEHKCWSGEEDNLPGQLRVADVDMNIEEDTAGDAVEQEPTVPESGTKDPEIKSAYGTLPHDLVDMKGCEGAHTCSDCHLPCDLRQEDCYCVEAPLGNPFPCTTLKVTGMLEKDMGEKCQFINTELAEKNAFREPEACCKNCKEICGYRCNRSKKNQKPDVPDSGTSIQKQPEAENVVNPEDEYTAQYFLKDEQIKLNQFLSVQEQGEKVPVKLLARQKMIVAALASVVCDLEMTGRQNTQPELPKMRNNDERKTWLRNYKEWGVWYKDEHIGATYYKYDFPNGTRLIVQEFHFRDFPGRDKEYYELHLVGGPSKRELDSNGVPKYPYHKEYSKWPDNETALVEFLKAIQK